MTPELFGNTVWWVRRLLEHHGNSSMAFNAQVRHIGTEYGEMLQELQKLYGDNPRRPQRDESAKERILDELADIIITTIITMAVAYRSDMSTNESAIAALAKLDERYEYVTNRLEQFDKEIEEGIRLDDMRH